MEENCLANARLLPKALEASGLYFCVSDIHHKKGAHLYKGPRELQAESVDEASAESNAGLLVIAFRFSDDYKKNYPHVTQESVSTLLRTKST